MPTSPLNTCINNVRQFHLDARRGGNIKGQMAGISKDVLVQGFISQGMSMYL